MKIVLKQLPAHPNGSLINIENPKCFQAVFLVAFVKKKNTIAALGVAWIDYHRIGERVNFRSDLVYRGPNYLSGLPTSGNLFAQGWMDMDFGEFMKDPKKALYKAVQDEEFWHDHDLLKDAVKEMGKPAASDAEGKPKKCLKKSRGIKDGIVIG